MSSKTGRPWYRKSTNSWYVWHSGRQMRLAEGKKNKAEAYARFAEILGSPPASSVVQVTTVAMLVKAYRTYLVGRIKESTAKSYNCVLEPFVERFGTRPAGDLRAEELESWARQGRWSPTTQRYALTVAAGVYRWATRSKLINKNPIDVLSRPPGKSRGAEILIDSALHERILAVSSPEFRDFLTVVRETGARPGEVAKVEAKDVVWDSHCWVLNEHKTSNTGRKRVIYLSEVVVRLCRVLAEKHPEGPIFRNTRGELWVKTGWKQAMQRVQRKLGLLRRPMVSGYRHTFATDALDRGVPDAHVAELLGHSSTSMIFRHYGHLASRSKTLRDSLDRIRGKDKEPEGE